MTTLGDWATRMDHPNDPRNAKELDFHYDVAAVFSTKDTLDGMPIFTIEGSHYVYIGDDIDDEELSIKDLYNTEIEGRFDDEEWDSDYVYDCFVERLAEVLDLDPLADYKWAFMRLH